jgi:hypothetical protein
MATEFQTNVGRMVWGHPAKLQDRKDPRTKQTILKDGKPVQQAAFGVAFPKADFQRDCWPFMAQEAATGYPNGVPPRFSWKYVDGDTIDSKGQPYNLREGYAGCYVLTIANGFAAPLYIRNPQNGLWQQLAPEGIKCGDYVALGLSAKVNVATGTDTPSLYINPTAVLLIGYGSEILSQSAVDPNALFANKQFALPPGASAQPMTPQGAMPQGMPGQPMQQPGMMPPPAHNFVQNAGVPQPGMMPGMMPQR